jgi:ABC-2 type transport system permease protein
MNEVLLLMAGAWRPDPKAKTEFTRLAVTGPDTGTINYMDLEMQMRGGRMPPRRVVTNEHYVVAAHVSGTVQPDEELFVRGKDSDEADATAGDDATDNSGANEADTDQADDPDAPESIEINAVLVSDIDWIAPVIFMLREIGQEEEMLINWKFQNVAFVLNMLDYLAGDDRFIDIRKRERSHRILEKIEEATEQYRQDSLEDTNKFVADASEQIEAVRQQFTDEIAKIEERTDIDPRAKRQLLEITQRRLERERDVKIASLEKERDRAIRQSERERDLQIRGVQNRYKTYAVVLPLIPPAVLAFFVYFHRRKAEREGVSKSRLRYGAPIDERATETAA